MDFRSNVPLYISLPLENWIPVIFDEVTGYVCDHLSSYLLLYVAAPPYFFELGELLAVADDAMMFTSTPGNDYYVLLLAYITY